jgi:hypothetical protein
MQTQELIRNYADRAAMLGIDLSTPDAVEDFREARSGRFGVRQYKRNRHWRDALTQLGVREAMEQGRDLVGEEFTPNLVTNEGLAHVLSSTLDGGTQVTTWYLTMSSTNTAAAGTMTAATPVFTEIDATDVTETVRETWTGGSVTGTTTASIDNAASVATYTCDVAGFTAYAAALIGGGTSAFGNTGGTLYSYSLFASEKVMASTDTIDVTYSFTSTDA